MPTPRWRVVVLSAAAGAVFLLVAAALFRGYPWMVEGRIVRTDPRFDQLLAKRAKVERIATGFGLAEGPAWDKNGGYLLVSDLPSNAIFKWQRGAGLELFLHPSGYSGTLRFEGPAPGANGLAFDLEGRLVVCEHGDRRITRIEVDGSKTVLADRYNGKRFNSPNDLVFGSNGDLYFTDPPFGLPGMFADPRRELAFSGVYKLSAAGVLTLLTPDITAPNGIALSPTESVLYVSNADPRQPAWFAYDIADDGSLKNGRVFAITPAGARSRSGPHDGMKMDRSGNVFATGPGGIHVFAPDGSHLGSIEVQGATNAAWGDDGTVLYITTRTAVYRIQTLTKGLGF